MRWWGSKPQSMTAQSLYSAVYLRKHFYSSPSAPPFLLPFLDHPFRLSLPPELSPIAPHNLPVYTAYFYLCARFFPPLSLSRSRSDRPTGRHSCLLSVTARSFMVIIVLCFLPFIWFQSLAVLRYQIFFKYNHLTPPDADDFWHVDLILSWVGYFSTKTMYILIEV